MNAFKVSSLSLAIAAFCAVSLHGVAIAKQDNPGQPFQAIESELAEIRQTTEETADGVGEILDGYWAPGQLDWVYFATRGTARIDVDVDAGAASDLNRSPVLLNVLVQTQGEGVAGLTLPTEFNFQNGAAPEMSTATVISSASDFSTAPGLYRLELTPLGGNWTPGKYVGVLKVEYQENLIGSPPGMTSGRALVVFEIPGQVIN